jgi:myo-inositol-1(or 4)-monophosphatase
MNLDRMREVAKQAALVGADAVRSADPHAAEGAEAKGLPGDWVTRVDVASERAIGAFLSSATPDVPMHGEELGGTSEGLRWIVDPLDGTTNFVHGFPAVGVSVALVDGKEPVAGAIAAPFLDDVWHAATGLGATWERSDGSVVACSVSSRPPARAIVATGFPFRRKERLPLYLAVLGDALERFEDLRRPGAACLDLAWVACGVFDGFFELGLAAWDVAAGGLLVREAGGHVGDWVGGEDFLRGNILAGPPQVFETLLSIVRSQETSQSLTGS